MCSLHGALEKREQVLSPASPWIIAWFLLETSKSHEVIQVPVCLLLQVANFNALSLGWLSYFIPEVMIVTGEKNQPYQHTQKKLGTWT